MGEIETPVLDKRRKDCHSLYETSAAANRSYYPCRPGRISFAFALASALILSPSTIVNASTLQTATDRDSNRQGQQSVQERGQDSSREVTGQGARGSGSMYVFHAISAISESLSSQNVSDLQSSYIITNRCVCAHAASFPSVRPYPYRSSPLLSSPHQREAKDEQWLSVWLSGSLTKLNTELKTH